MTISINISKADTLLQVNWDAMPENAKAHIIEYGLRQKLNDAGSQFKKDEEGCADKALNAAEAVLEALMAGQVTIRKAATKVDAFHLNAAKEFYKKAVNAKLPAGFELDDFILAVAKALNKTPEAVDGAVQIRAGVLMKQAAAIAAIKAQSPDLDIALD